MKIFNSDEFYYSEVRNRKLRSILLGLIIRIHDNLVLLCHDARIRLNVTPASSNNFENIYSNAAVRVNLVGVRSAMLKDVF